MYLSKPPTILACAMDAAECIQSMSTSCGGLATLRKEKSSKWSIGPHLGNQSKHTDRNWCTEEAFESFSYFPFITSSQQCYARLEYLLKKKSNKITPMSCTLSYLLLYICVWTHPHRNHFSSAEFSEWCKNTMVYIPFMGTNVSGLIRMAEYCRWP